MKRIAVYAAIATVVLTAFGYLGSLFISTTADVKVNTAVEAATQTKIAEAENRIYRQQGEAVKNISEVCTSTQKELAKSTAEAKKELDKKIEESRQRIDAVANKGVAGASNEVTALVRREKHDLRALALIIRGELRSEGNSIKQSLAQRDPLYRAWQDVQEGLYEGPFTDEEAGVPIELQLSALKPNAIRDFGGILELARSLHERGSDTAAIVALNSIWRAPEKFTKEEYVGGGGICVRYRIRLNR